jgi:hypothetical protein
MGALMRVPVYQVALAALTIPSSRLSISTTRALVRIHRFIVVSSIRNERRKLGGVALTLARPLSP